MTWRAKLRNPFVQQYLIEILFPLVGYFFFDWSLTIIAVFYLVDQLSAEIAFVRRLHRIARAENITPIYLVSLAVISFVVLFVCEVVFLYTSFLDIQLVNATVLNDEITTFVKDELWLLFPLVILLYQFKDTFTFYMPRRYLLFQAKKTLIYHTISNVILLTLIVAGITLWKLNEVQDLVILITFLIVKLIFDFTITRWFENKTKK